MLAQPTNVPACEQLSYASKYAGMPLVLPMARMEKYPNRDTRAAALRLHYKMQSYAGRANIFFREGPKRTAENIQRFFGVQGFFGRPYALEKPKKYTNKQAQELYTIGSEVMACSHAGQNVYFAVRNGIMLNP